MASGSRPGPDHALAIDDYRLLLAEARQGALDGLQVSLAVQADVGGIRPNRVQGDPFDAQLSFQVRLLARDKA